MTENLRAILVVAALAVAVTIGVLLFARPDTAPAEPAAAPAAGPVAAELLVRPDSHRTSTAPDGAVTFVEFLDFECPSCAAAYPAVEQLRVEFGDRVQFVVRQFPLPGHANAVPAAVAAEAAGQQGAFDEMAEFLFRTQPEWGGRDDDQSATFRAFAQALDLDLAAYDAAVADPAVLQRVQRDQADGIAAGVGGTPTFFLDDRLVGEATFEQLRGMLAEAAAR